MRANTILVRLLGVSTIGVIALSSSGCVELALIAALAGDNDTTVEVEPDTTGRIPTDDYYYSDPASALDVQYESLSGTLGTVGEFNGGITSQNGQQYGDVASIQVDATDADGALMVLLTIEGGTDHPDLVPGATFNFNYDEYYGSSYDPSGSADRLFISALGCTGDSPGAWDYDRSANEVTLTVEQGAAPEERVFNYTANWDDGSTTVGTVALN